MDYPKEIVKKLYQTAPPEISEFVATPETSKINDEFAKDYGLDKEKRVALGDEVTNLLLGLTKKSEFPGSLEKRMAISRDIAGKISVGIQNLILSKIPEPVLTAQIDKANEALGNSRANSPIITTKETKEEALQRLKQVRVEKENSPAPQMPAKAPEIHPMVEEGERVHDTAPMTEKEKVEIKEPSAVVATEKSPIQTPETKLMPQNTATSQPVTPTTPKKTPAQSQKTPTNAPSPASARYPGGVDPYREPLV